MPKPAVRAYSRYSQDAVALLGQMIRETRLERKLTAAQMAERAGISRGLIQRIEQGDPGCTIGVVFEVAAILGVKLFDADPHALATRKAAQERIVALLPKKVRSSTRAVKDDF
ncbi:helix-turn-helix transcriptional regulator [Asticcacaulis benevestitus]|nr:helix-turn-helix transcriptional regulator [Asticcacaulis benevestitus]